jgi:DNA polymerase-3 subunit beta
MLNKIDTITLNRKDLISKLQFIKKIIPAHTKDLSLKRAYTQVEDGALYVTACNSEQVLKIKICEDVNVKLNGNFNPVSVLNFIKKAKSDEIELSLLDDGKLNAVSGKVNFTDTPFGKAMWDIEYKNPERYEEELTYFEIPTSKLVKTFNEIQSSISTEEVRYCLNGVYMHWNDDQSLNFVATNGHILAKRVLEVEHNVAKSVLQKGVIIPKDAIKYLLDFTKKSADEIKIKLTESCMSFEFGDLSLRTSLIDGNYPNYLLAIPQGTNLRISTDKTDLLEAIDLFTIQKTKAAIKFSFDVDRERLELGRLCGVSGDLSASVYSVTNKQNIAESAVFGLHNVYIKQTLATLNDGVMDFHITMDEKEDDDGDVFWVHDAGPIVVKSLRSSHADDVNVIMPKRF